MVESTVNQTNWDITYKFIHIHCTYIIIIITYNNIEVQARVLVQAYMQVYTRKAAARLDYYSNKKYSHISLLGLFISNGGTELIFTVLFSPCIQLSFIH